MNRYCSIQQEKLLIKSYAETLLSYQVLSYVPIKDIYHFSKKKLSLIPNKLETIPQKMQTFSMQSEMFSNIWSLIDLILNDFPVALLYFFHLWHNSNN